MSAVEIRDNEPIPERERGKLPHYPELSALKPGQCAVFSPDKAMAVRNAIGNITRSTGRRFTTRMVEEDDERNPGAMVRKFMVWRVED